MLYSQQKAQLSTMTLRDLSVKAQLPEAIILDWAKSKLIPSYQINGSLRFDPVEVFRHIKSISLHGQSVASNEAGSLKSESEWLNTKSAALYLGISEKTLFNLTSSGQIPYFKFGRRNRYKLEDLRNLLNAKPRGGFNGN